ncbi:MAG: tRNA (guanosine(46)-N7)-methyltransferase TrmB [bacterium]
MAKKKLIRFTENLSFLHLFQPRYMDLSPHFWLQGKWGSEYFRNEHPITLELGCGKGEYTVGLAHHSPEKNFIGIDIKGARLWRGCKTVEEEGLKNVAFIRIRADHIESLFAPGEIAEIWIAFPDPQVGKKRKRLTSPVFLNRYKKILTRSGIIHLKTDDRNLFTYTLEKAKEFNMDLILATEDLYKTHPDEPAAKIQTYYEEIWLEEGRQISYLKFRFKE